MKHKQIEKQGQAYPDGRPYDSFFNRNPMIFFVKYAQIEGEHDEYKNVKTDPEIDTYTHYFPISPQN
jgi:hypothetical protein